MRFTFLFLLLCMVTPLSAQQAPLSEAPLQAGTVYDFAPLSMPKQKRPVMATPPPAISVHTVVTVLWVVFGLVMLVFLIGLLPKLNGWILKLLFVLAWLVVGAAVSYVFMAIRFFGVPRGETSKSTNANVELYQMTEALGMNDSYNRLLPDDDFRLAFAMKPDRFMIADYHINKGWIFPLVHIDSVTGYAATRDSLPALPTPDEQHWVFETEAAKAATDTLQYLELHLKGIQPARIYVRYKETEANELPSFPIPAESIAKSLMEYRRGLAE